MSPIVAAPRNGRFPPRRPLRTVIALAGLAVNLTLHAMPLNAQPSLTLAEAQRRAVERSRQIAAQELEIGRAHV